MISTIALPLLTKCFLYPLDCIIFVGMVGRVEVWLAGIVDVAGVGTPFVRSLDVDGAVKSMLLVRI